jgi:hypothetical protein
VSVCGGCNAMHLLDHNQSSGPHQIRPWGLIKGCSTMTHPLAIEQPPALRCRKAFPKRNFRTLGGVLKAVEPMSNPLCYLVSAHAGQGTSESIAGNG